jgi:hypothetical protein
MASIRILKKDINILTFDLLTECYTYKYFQEAVEENKFDEVIKKIVYLRNDLILRTNHPESDADSASLKTHYRKIREDLFELTRVIEELKK